MAIFVEYLPIAAAIPRQDILALTFSNAFSQGGVMGKLIVPLSCRLSGDI